MRGQLIALVYAKLLKLPADDAGESAAMSLMGTDIQRIAETFWYLLIEVIPDVTQLSVALFLLYLQLGAVCVAPLLITLSKSTGTRY